MRLRPVVALTAWLLVAACVRAERVEILRDRYGVPHIFASTPAGAAYGSGYAQAEDRLEELLKNYRRAEGTMAEVFGPSFLGQDYRQRVWRHREVSEKTYPRIRPEVRAMCEAFIAGVETYMREHPAEVPPWAEKLYPWFVPMLGRHITWGWMEAEVGGKLLRSGIRPDPAAYHGSNEWALAPSRTAMHAPIALIDPHLSWYGEFRWYEIRLYAGKHAISGAAILGLPFPSLGHSQWASVAMTTGGPDTSDVFREEISGGKYRFRGEWRPLELRHERIGAKTGDSVSWKDYTIASTHHGPIVAHKGTDAFSAAVPYMDQFQLIEESWDIMNARTLADMKKSLGMLQLMPQNIMVATVDGDIYYLRNGRVPVRPKSCDPSRPMPGSGACEWECIHPLSDLVQIENPSSGYMQNCNISPQWLFTGSPLTPERYAARPYLYNTSGPPIQRARELLRLLDAAKDVDARQATSIAFWTGVYGAGAWQKRIAGAAEPSAAASLIAKWDRRLDADSRGALAFYLFKSALDRPEARAVEPPESLSDDRIREALETADERLRAEYPGSETYGSLFRVGRDGSDRTWPVGGGTLKNVAMETIRAISFGARGKEMVANGGQTATQIVVLTRPPQSYMVIPLGESDRKDSPHFDDQARELFSRSAMKPTYFMDRKQLEANLERREELEYVSSASSASRRGRAAAR